MNKVIKLGVLAAFIAISFTGCKDPEQTTTEVKVTTYSATEITATTAQAGGHVTIKGEATITELGLCWSIQPNPTTEDAHLSTTTTNEPFNCTLTDLQPETTYHIRAYAIGESECYYGEDLNFTTLAGPSQPQGLLSGVFTVGPDKKIRFSQGNLQYQASTSLWRTPTNGDWGTLFEYRETLSGIRFAMACVGDANGILLFPDDWDASIYTINEANRFETGAFTINTIPVSDWSGILEPAGVVFLPAAGMRNGTEVVYPNEAGTYWSSTNYNSYAHCLLFIPTEGGDPHAANDRNLGFSVRLVQDCE